MNGSGICEAEIVDISFYININNLNGAGILNRWIKTQF